MEIKDIRKLTLTQRHDLIYQLNSAKREDAKNYANTWTPEEKP